MKLRNICSTSDVMAISSRNFVRTPISLIIKSGPWRDGCWDLFFEGRYSRRRLLSGLASEDDWWRSGGGTTFDYVGVRQHRHWLACMLFEIMIINSHNISDIVTTASVFLAFVVSCRPRFQRVIVCNILLKIHAHEVTPNRPFMRQHRVMASVFELRNSFCHTSYYPW